MIFLKSRAEFYKVAEQLVGVTSLELRGKEVVPSVCRDWWCAVVKNPEEQTSVVDLDQIRGWVKSQREGAVRYIVS